MDSQVWRLNRNRFQFKSNTISRPLFNIESLSNRVQSNYAMSCFRYAFNMLLPNHYSLTLNHISIQNISDSVSFSFSFVFSPKSIHSFNYFVSFAINFELVVQSMMKMVNWPRKKKTSKSLSSLAFNDLLLFECLLFRINLQKFQANGVFILFWN